MPHECTDCGRRFDDGSKEMLSGCPDCGGNKFQFHPTGRTESPSEEPPEPPEPPEPAANSTVARTVGNAATAVRDLVGGSSSSGTDSSPEFDTTTDDEPTLTVRERTPDDSPRPWPSETEDSDPPGDSQSSDPAGSTRPTDERRREDSDPSKRRNSSPDQRRNPGSEQGIAGSTANEENAAQASARSEVVSTDDLPPAPDSSTRSRPAPVMDETSESDPADEPTPDADERPDLAELREQLNEQFESIRVLEPGQYELNLMELYDREEYIIALQEDGKYTIQVPERWQD